MCGRAYETYTEEELAMRYRTERSKRNPLDGFRPTYNLCPTQLSPVLHLADGARVIELMRFGLVPKWAETVKAAEKYSLINAKAEEVETKRSYKEAFRQRRCIVPISGFYEWLRPASGPKRPFAIRLAGSPIMSVAAIWEEWESPATEERIRSFALLTTSSNHFMSKIHDRMPVILPPAAEDAWLDPANNGNVPALKRLLLPCPEDWLAAQEVSPAVNSPRNNSPELLAPFAGPNQGSFGF